MENYKNFSELIENETAARLNKNMLYKNVCKMYDMAYSLYSNARVRYNYKDGAKDNISQSYEITDEGIAEIQKSVDEWPSLRTKLEESLSSARFKGKKKELFKKLEKGEIEYNENIKTLGRNHEYQIFKNIYGEFDFINKLEEIKSIEKETIKSVIRDFSSHELGDEVIKYSINTSGEFLVYEDLPEFTQVAMELLRKQTKVMLKKPLLQARSEVVKAQIQNEDEIEAE